MILQIPKRQKDKQIYVENKKTKFKRLKCPSCTQIFQQPQRLFCGHTICNKCLQNQKLTSQHFKKALKCSFCYEQIDQQKIGPDRIAQGIIDNLTVKCSAKGCKWEGYNKQFKQHYQYECEFVPKIPQSEYEYNFYSHGAQFVRKVKDCYEQKQKQKLNQQAQNHKNNPVKFNMTTDIRLLIEKQAEIRDRWNDEQWMKKSKSQENILDIPNDLYVQAQSHQIQSQTINLTKSGSSYLQISYLPQPLSSYGRQIFPSIWQLHPPTRHKIIFNTKQLQVHRYSQSYLHTPTNLSHIKERSYMYSGFNTSQNNKQLPQQLTPFYKYIQQIDPLYNQVITNWYHDKNDYIALHSDCQLQMVDNAKVSVLSFYQLDREENYRYMKIIVKNNVEESNRICEEFVIRLDHGMILTMAGKCQKQFKHGIEKVKNDVCPRISVSFRQMIPNQPQQSQTKQTNLPQVITQTKRSKGRQLKISQFFNIKNKQK